MNGEWNLKPHGTFARKPENGAYIAREPKGIPDILLFARESDEGIIMEAAAVLSVQGITARIVLVADMDLFMKQDNDYIQSIFSSDIPVRIGLLNNGKENLLKAVFLPENSDRNTIVQTAVKELRTCV